MSLPNTPRPPAAASSQTSQGFTLIEVLVALVIVAIALGAGIKAAGALTNNAQRLAEGVRDGLKLDVGHAQPALRLTSTSLTSACRLCGWLPLKIRAWWRRSSKPG